VSAAFKEQISQDFLLARLIETEAQLKEAIDLLSSRLHEIAAERSKPPKTLTVDEVAAFLHVEPKTIRHWTGKGKIPFRRANSSIFFLLDELLEWTKPGSIAGPARGPRSGRKP
jgi:excisionase family DNA binding protein